MSVAAVVPGPAGGDLAEQGGAARRHPLLRRQRAHGEKMMITLNGGGGGEIAGKNHERHGRCTAF